MLKYDLLGQTVVFEDAAERYYDLMFASNQTCLKASQQFKTWYGERGNIQAVLDDYLPFAESIVEQLAFQALFSQLATCEIYDMSEETYWKRCISLGESESALETVERQYNNILKQHNAEIEYRADRKAGRSRWVGGGFGLSGALKGATQAAALNAVSGLGHSVFNAIGNAGSALSASMDKSALYKNAATQDTLLHGILTDLCAVYFAHIDLINKYKSDYIRSPFNEDKSSALFENAKKLPDKREELLVQAFTLCPWSAELVKYIFIYYPRDRKNAYAAAQRFSVDLSGMVEEILSQEYNEEAQSSEQAAQAAKERILAHMREYGVLESATLDRLETDCLRRLCEGYQVADEETCNQLVDKVRQYPAQERLKEPFYELLQKRIESIWREELTQICQGYETANESTCENMVAAIKAHKAPDAMKLHFLQKIQSRIESIWREELTQICRGYEAADESACEKMIVAIKAHKAPDAMKLHFLQKIQSRIESIWAAEDGEIFDNLYMKTDITDPQAVAEAIAYVQSKGRTGASKQYLDALNACTAKNIERARLYQNTSRYKLYIVLAILSIIGAVTWFLAIPLFYMAWKMKKTWKLLTINGTMLHPALLSAPS